MKGRMYCKRSHLKQGYSALFFLFPTPAAAGDDVRAVELPLLKDSLVILHLLEERKREKEKQVEQ